MKQFFILTLLSLAVLTSCKKDTTTENNTSTQKVTNTQSKSVAIGTYEGSILGYQVFKVNLKADNKATVTKAKAKDNAVTSIGDWSQDGNFVTVTTDRSSDYFYIVENGLVKVTGPNVTPTEAIKKDNLLEKK